MTLRALYPLRLLSRQFLKETYFTLNGWRFENLKEHINKTVEGTLDPFVVSDSLRRLQSESDRRRKRLAVISVLPPAETGIAHCAHSTFIAANYPVDIYTKYRSRSDYLRGVYDERLPPKKVRVFDLDSLPIGLKLNSYIGKVFIIGNSFHNFEIVSALRTERVFPTSVPKFVHIHDPCLLNILRMVCSTEDTSFESVIRYYYSDYIDDMQKFNNDDDLSKHGIFGIKALLNSVYLDGIFVNSNTAKEFIRRDWPEFPADRIHVLFHPVFPLQRAHCVKENRTGPALGSFGIPSRGKKTELVISVWKQLKRDYPNLTLTLAGFGAGVYAERNGLYGRDGLIIHDSPSDRELEELVGSVDVAIQLRKMNLGESSGIVAQLLASRIPTIVPDVGSFLEYGDAVRHVPHESTNVQLADAVRSLLEASSGLERGMQKYCEQHSPERFCKELWRLCNQTSGRRTSVTPTRKNS